jgi:hypothetical protein
MAMSSQRLLAAYYLLGTLAFVVLDLWIGTSIRVPGLEGNGIRWGYYGGLLLMGGLALRFPPTAPWIGMGESVVNLVLILLSILLPIWSLAEVLEAGGEPAEVVMGAGGLLGSGLAAAVFIFGFYEAVLRASRGGSGPVA